MSEGLPIPEVGLAVLEQAVNRYIALDPEGAARLAGLQGRVIRIEIAGFDTRLSLIPGPTGIQIYGDYEGEPDCILRGTPLSLARMSVSRRKEDRLFAGEVEVEGDTGLAQAFSDFLGALDVDWEEQLSELVGDAAAYQVGSRLRALGRWGRRTADTLREDLGEYLQEEARLLPGQYEVQAFLDEVDRLRDDVERLAARTERLARKLEGMAGAK